MRDNDSFIREWKKSPAEKNMTHTKEIEFHARVIRWFHVAFRSPLVEVAALHILTVPV